jgi:hypothetical protein
VSTSRVQASTPIGNFDTNPYPFGTIACEGIGGWTPGGRCGWATSPASPSARIRMYTSP